MVRVDEEIVTIRRMYRHVSLNVHCLSLFILRTKICISAHAPSKKLRIAVKFTGHSTVLGPPYVNFFTSAFFFDVWNFEVFSKVLENLSTPAVRCVTHNIS